VLGSLLIDAEAIHKLAVFLKAEDFYDESNRRVYEACISLYERNEAINQITLSQELARRGKLDGIGGASYLSHLVSTVPTSVAVEYYARIVSRLAAMRRLIIAAEDIADIGYEAQPDADAALSRAEDILFGLRRSRSSRDLLPIRQILDEYFEEGVSPRTIEGARPHVLTGFPAIDEILGGLQRSDMVVLGARPSLGKSSLALSIARNMAVEQGACVAIFSLEMAKEQLAQRLVAGESGVDSRRIRLGLNTEREERQIMEAIGVLSEAPIYVDDSPVLGASEVRSKARRLHNERSIDFIIIDYLQLLQGDGRYQNPVQQMSYISQSLKALARELNVPMLAVSQLSRAVESRTPRTPQLSDLRESGSIEQDADVVAFIYRDDVYYTREDWERQYPSRPYPSGVADIIIAKHRNGPTGQVKLHFRKNLARFESEDVIA
jgi:replicative DNA helicase